MRIKLLIMSMHSYQSCEQAQTKNKQQSTEMARTFRVGILGEQGVASEEYFWGSTYGVEAFDLTADQICNLLENTDTEKSVQTSHSNSFPAPVMTYTIMGGGRFYPALSREELSKAVEGMEILITRMNFSSSYSFFGRQFFEAIFTENLSDKCQVVIARIVGAKQSISSGVRSRQIKTDEFLETYGLDIGKLKYKGKFFVITDKSKTESKSQKKNKGNKVSIDRVRSELASEELKVAITQPMKETVTAGKAVIGLGARVGKWFSSLIKTH